MLPRLLGLPVALQPAVDLLAEALGRVARVAVDVPHLVHVVLRSLVGVARKVVSARARMVPAEDAVVAAAVPPSQELLYAPHGVGGRPPPFGEDAQQPIPARVPLLVLG